MSQALSERGPDEPRSPQDDRGWGKAKGPTAEEKALRLADRLAARVRAWEAHPSMNNYWAMLSALEDYERTIRG